MSHQSQKAGKQIANVIFTASLFLSTTAFAIPGNYYLGGMLDTTNAAIGNSNPTIAYPSGTTITDNYPPNNTRHTAILFNLNGGYEFASQKWWPATAMGLGIYRTINEYNVSGHLVETESGNSNDLYTYQYNVKQWIAMAEMKFTWVVRQFAPYVNVGVGPSWNLVTNYHENPVFSDGFVVYPPFQSNTNVNLAYEIGVGMGYEFNFNGDNASFMHERVSLGYQYMNFGNLKFGDRNADYPYRLEPGRFTANNFYVSLTHLF
jgi:hypothetical protein